MSIVSWPSTKRAQNATALRYSMADKQSHLSQRFRHCLFDLKFEDLEDRTLPWIQGKDRADYLRRIGHSVIIEQKDIQVDDEIPFIELTTFTANKIKQYQQSWTGYNIDAWNSEDAAYYREVKAQARKRLDRPFRKANKQIRETREVLNLPSSHGMVLVVNQLAGKLNDGLCCLLMGEILEARTDNGEPCLPDVDGFFYVQNLPKGRKTYDGKESIFFSMLRNVPRSALIAPLVKEIHAKFYPGSNDLRHPAEIFTSQV